MLLGVGPGDDVLVPTLTFVATANAVAYVGARPVFVDSDRATWNLDPALVEEELAARFHAGRDLPAALLAVDLYGQCADWDPILASCADYGVPVIEDAAEALGATYRGKPAGSFGVLNVFSFNGNKIITTSGGGMLVGDDPAVIERARHLSTQARDPAPHYEHTEIGFNYRMSNLLAAVGRGQLEGLPAKVARRRAINARYRAAFADVDGIGFMPERARRRADQLAHRDHGRRSRLACFASTSSRSTSRPARRGSRCTCSRCSPAARCAAAPSPRRSSAPASASRAARP